MTPSMKAHTQILFLKHREQSLTFKEINILVYFHLLKEKSGFSTRTLRYPLATLKTTAQFCCYVTLRNGKPGSSFLTTSQQMWHIQELKTEGAGGGQNSCICSIIKLLMGKICLRKLYKLHCSYFNIQTAS